MITESEIISSKNHSEVITIKVKEKFNDMVDNCVETDTHFTKSSFIRNAVREKIRRDFPKVWEEIKKGDGSE